MIKICRTYILSFLAIFSVAKVLSGQERTIIEFYSEVPAVSDYVIDLKADMTSGVTVLPEGWRIPPGQHAKIELPFVPPNYGIVEVRLAFDWEGHVVSGAFEGWSADRFKYKVFDEPIYPHENQKRIYPSMLARSYEFRIRCNISLRPDQPSLILQSLVIYWQRVADD